MTDEFPQIVVADDPRQRSAPRIRFLPQISLLQLLLIVTIIALSAAYYSKTVETKSCWKSRMLDIRTRYRQYALEANINHQLGRIPARDNYNINIWSGLPHDRSNLFNFM